MTRRHDCKYSCICVASALWLWLLHQRQAASDLCLFTEPSSCELWARACLRDWIRVSHLVTQHIRLSDRLRQWVSWLQWGLRGSCLGFTRSQNQKQRGKNGLGKINEQKIYLWLNKHVRGGMLSSPDQQFLLGALMLAPTFTCSQVDSLHLKVRRRVKAHSNGGDCTRPVHHMQLILHCKAARLSCHGEDRMPFVTRFLRQTTICHVK